NEGRGREGNENYRIYGAFMKYASFIIQTGLELEDLPGQEVTFPLALGDATEGDFTLSTASASWEGVMVATTRTGAVANNILQGDASLTYTGADNTLDIAFANIVDIDRGGANHSLTSLKFDDVRVAAEGTYAMRDDNGYVDGAFYGPSHEEAAGVFEYSNLVGSFGALQTEIEILFTDVTPTLLTAVGGEAATADIIDEGAGNALAGPETTATTVADILQDRLGGAMTFTPPDGYTVQGITLEADGTTTGPFTAETNADGIYTPAQTAEEGRNQVLVDEDRSAVLYRHTASGLVLIESRQRDSARRAFGSWLKNASFAVITGVEVDPRIDPNAAGPVSYAYAAGDATGDGNFDFGSPSAATTSASWEGVMVATARIGTAAGSILQGDALLTYVVDDNAVDIDFTNIVNIDREGADHSVTQVSFNDVSVTSQGTYAMSSINRSVSGAFYGPSHAEAAGVFRASGLVGSFGALLQEDEIETLFTEVTPTLLTALGGETPTTTVADILEDRLGGETAFASPDGYIVQLVTLTQSSGMTTPSLTATANGDQIYTPAQTAEEGRRQVLVDEDRSTVLYRHTASGLDLIESRQRDADRRAFGSWMQNASFAVITNVDVTDVQPNAQSLVSYAYAAGDPTGSNLTGYIGRATWEGVMLATARTGNVAGNILQGDASLTFGQDNGSAGYLLDIAFTNIRDIDRGGAPHGDGSDIEFPDVAVSENGRYAVAETGNNGQSLAGAFYGPSHEEAAGVFEHSNLVGSFGALLRDDETETLFTEVTPELLTAVGGEVADLLDEGAGDALAGPETTTTTIAHIRAARIDSAGNFIDDDLSPVEFDSIDGAAYYVENKGEDDENVITFTSTCTGESSSTTTIINCPLDSGGYTANAPYNPALLTDEDTSAVLYRHAASGLEMIESRQRDSARRAFGSWMEYASFAVITESTVVETTPETGPLTFAFAAGDATGARPTNNIVSATWEGVMVATTLTGDAAGNILQGDASLEYTGADNELDVMFDRIVNIDLDGAAHSDPSFGFEDVILQADGTYTQRTTNNDGVILERLDGSLYGPGHEEAAGFFEHSDSGLVGSFGAFQTEIETPFLEVTQALLDAVGGEETDTTVADIRGARINSEGDFIDDDGLDVTFNRVDEIVYSADGLAFQRTRCRSGGTSSSINTDIVCDLSTLRNNESVDIAVRFNPDFLADESGSMVLYRHSNSELDIIESAQVDSDRRTFGAWMEYAYFGVVTDTIIDDERLTLVVASGETTGNRPNSNIASATWDGVMVATTITGAVAGNILQGDALLEYDGSDNTLDIDFTEIVDIDRAGDDHSVPSVGFEDVGLSENGTYEVDEEDDNGISLSGALYGPGYENAAGTFEHSGMVGSFGADFAFESITAPNSGGE
ncbi:MAG: hypothetical protein GDA40_02995, partial [Rhodobacteraceae bacterium]|nr:hypothetical protein [Paracoccaceae bacterium]